PGAQGDDTEMKDATNAAESTSTPAITQTRASKKKGEHKTKRLNKKALSKQITNLDAEPGQYYLARMKGYPPWPSVICDEEMLPMDLLQNRPVTTKLPDGTYKGLSTPIVENAHMSERSLSCSCGAWMPNTDLTPLETSAIDTTDTKGISKPLAAAYIKALEANDLQSYKDMLAGYQREEQEAQAERDAKKSAKSKRKRFDASATPADDDTDETDTDEDESQFKKRKKDVDNNAEEIPAKTPKTATKLNLSTLETPVETSSKDKASKSRSSSKKASKEKESDEDAFGN
ncbi:MAG: hypothetical protein L6R36_006861, partial [Xanthoria steineri]